MSTGNLARGRPPSIAVPNHLCDLLLRIAEGWAPAAMDPGSVECVRLDDVDFTELTRTSPSLETAWF